MIDQRITFKYILATLGAVIFTWVLHEFIHWTTSELLGYESILRLNSVSPVGGQKQMNEWHRIYISASGPLITIFQAVITFQFLLRKGWSKILYPFFFTPFYMRSIAGIMNFVNPNDEGKISEFLGLGLFTLSIIVSSLLFFLVYKISKKYELNWKFNLWTILVIMAASSILILSDQLFEIRLI